MSKNFHFKKNDDDKKDGAAKHRFNAEYSDEFGLNSKKAKKISKRINDEKLRQFADLY
jgi:hypothetical protein